MVVEEDATAVTKFGFVRVITEGLKVISCLFVGNEVDRKTTRLQGVIFSIAVD